MIRDGLTHDEIAMASAGEYNIAWQVLMTTDDLAAVRAQIKAFELQACEMRNLAEGVKAWLFYKLGEKGSRKSEVYDDAYSREFYWKEIASHLGRAEGCFREAIRTLELIEIEDLNQVDVAQLVELSERGRRK